MSWMKTVEGNLVNLEYVESVTLNELEEPEGGFDIAEPTHGIFANNAEGESFSLFQGDEEYCRAKLEQLLSKLPMVRP